MIDLRASSPYSELNYVIKRAFETYDIKKISIPEKSPLNDYKLQILSREGNKMVVNCSSNIIYDRIPVYEGCESSNDFSEKRSCISTFLVEHFKKNISLDFLKNRKVFGTLQLKPEFIVNESGIVEKVKGETATDSLTIETERIMALFPKAKTPPTRNGNPTSIYLEEFINVEIGSNDENYIENAKKAKIKEFFGNAIKTEDTTLNPNCELALHFKKYITDDISKDRKLFQNANAVISFSLDKKGKIINLKAETYKQELSKRFVEIFKKFPLEKLNIKQPNVLETYSYTIFTVEYDNKTVIHCNENPNIFSWVYFDQKCKKSSSPEDLKFRFQEKFTNQIVKNFDNSLIIGEDINNGLRLVFIVQVDVDGTLSRINAMNTNPKYSNELDRIIKKMPKVYRPAYWNGKPIKTTYTIPISS